MTYQIGDFVSQDKNQAIIHLAETLKEDEDVFRDFLREKFNNDSEKLLEVLARLTDSGNSVVVIEHNLDVIKTADHIIDLGPDGGDGGGQVIATGTPEEIAKSGTYTGKFLEKMLNENITPYAKELVEDFGK